MTHEGNGMSGKPTEIPDAAPTVGAGRYFVVNRIGEGGMAGVYRVWDTRLRVWRAIKVLFPQYARRKAVRRRFVAEAHAMARLEHENLVRMYDVEEDGELPFLVMELVMGGNLYDWLQRFGPMPPQLACAVIRQIAAGVDAAHGEGIVHRDVKPQNVLVSPTGTCKLTDFGVALQTGAGLTREGASLGTRGYMAPEQYGDAANVDERADIYALGATLYTLLTGQVPLDLFQHGSRPELLEPVPQPLRAVIRVCCAASPEDRLRRVSSFDAAIVKSMGQLPPDPATTPPLTADLASHEPVGPNPDFPEIRAILERAESGSPATSRAAAPPLATPGPAARSSSEPAKPAVQAIPYMMPDVQGKATPLRERYRDDSPDSVPDYVDQEALAATPRPEQRVQAPEVVSASSEPVPRTITPAPAAPGARDEVIGSAPRAPRRGTPPPVDRATPMAPPRRRRRLPAWMLVGGGMVGAALIVAMVAGGVLASGRAQLSARYRDVDHARQRVHQVLEDEATSLIASLPPEERPRVDAAYLDYEAVREEPARIQAALALIDEIEAALPRASGFPGDPASMDRTRARHIDMARSGYEQSLVAWERRTTGGTSGLVFSMGLVDTPPELRE